MNVFSLAYALSSCFIFKSLFFVQGLLLFRNTYQHVIQYLTQTEIASFLNLTEQISTSLTRYSRVSWQHTQAQNVTEQLLLSIEPSAQYYGVA